MDRYVVGVNIFTMRILLIEDDQDLSESLKAQLESACFAVDCATDGEAGSFMGRTTDYDLVIMDLYLPKKNGSTVCTEFRAAGKTMPILAMSVSDKVMNRVDLLNLGADDFLVKPFSSEEMLARVRALLRRPATLLPQVLVYGRVSLDPLRQKVTVDQKDEIHLTRKEFNLLEYFMRNQGIVASRSMLLEHVWDGTLDAFTNTIETHVLSLRKKLQSAGVKKLIHTVSGRGYVFEER